MSKDVGQEEMGSWLSQDELQKTIAAGLHGPPELKKAEKNRYLGQFRERVIRMLSKRQVSEPAIYPEIVEALKDPRAFKLLINGEIPQVFTAKYQKLAKQIGINYSLVHDAELKGETGLIVAAKDAVEVSDIEVPDRELRLSNLGVPKELIHLAGKNVCQRCYDKIIKAAPEESINYQVISWLDRLMGERCPAGRIH
ncbi:YueI family protein [Desulfotomaculum sp. 1211_IL3151]|uniref:YueI family protein n=1 Tax=Desulfotomaculum sp. 1211_IL3151 TaxID=3084055 RepID=UPI002FDB6A6D